MQKKHHILLYSLLLLCLGLTVGYAALSERESRRYARALEEAYQGTLLSAMTQMEAMRLNIDKALVSADAGQSAALISRISSDASSVQSGLASLPLSQQAMGDAVKLCNQLSDYAASLLTRAQETVDSDTAQTLQALSLSCEALLNALRKAYAQMQTGKLSFFTLDAYMQDADGVNRPLESVANSLDYPTLIYDGPFSDVLSENAPRGLGEESLDAAQALQRAQAYVGQDAQVSLTQESGGAIPAYGVRAELNDCVLQMAITKTGGKVLWMFPEYAEFEVRYGLAECTQAGLDFLSAHDYGEMALTFWQTYGGMTTLSFAAVQEGVLLYPDLIKVQVRMDTLQVVGIEARHYLSSHTVREDVQPTVSQEEAQGAVSALLTLQGTKLCVIPLNRSEYLCWEFTGTYNGQTYFVYIDAKTGQQRDIQRLVYSDSGPKAS